MYQPTLDELERAADEILSKSKKSEKLDAGDISDQADEYEDEPEEDESEDESEDEPEEDESEEETKKSLETEPLDDDTEVAEYMSATAEVVAKSLCDVMEALDESGQQSEKTSAILAKSLLAQNAMLEQHSATLAGLQETQKSIEGALAELSAKLDSFGAQPAHMRKSVASYAINDRNFAGSLQGPENEPQPLSKSEKLAILTNELQSGSAIVRAEDVLALESGCPVRPEIQTLINAKSRG